MDKFGMEIYSAAVFAVTQNVLSIGRLMSPGDIAEAMQTRSKIEKEVIKGWHICGEMHPDMWKLAYRNPDLLKTRLQTMRPTDGKGCAFAFIFQEIDDWQHRFVIPLAGPSVRGFVDSLENESVSISMANRENENAFTRSICIPDGAKKDIRESFRTEWTDPIGQFQDASTLCLRMMLPDFVPPIAARAINWACVTLVVPDDIRALSQSMEQRYKC